MCLSLVDTSFSPETKARRKSFRVTLLIEDETDQAHAVLTGKEAEEICGISCENLIIKKNCKKPKNHTTRNSSIRRRDQTAEIEDWNKKRFPYKGGGYTKMFTSSHQLKISNQQLPCQILLDLGRRGEGIIQSKTKQEPKK
ncbi:hypothetical protein RchiOBHm_Chr4g0444601 [Rosa chinensis]|uniref:Nucleic acid-binding protein n=1 Tax=Rosa chinensis TaxID=74649 RepID=A0A2P6R482_ROSCH|nr:hypothetical protein RchiOBHm_Chr4g0444601 [Rosa chinensis]